MAAAAAAVAADRARFQRMLATDGPRFDAWLAAAPGDPAWATPPRKGRFRRMRVGPPNPDVFALNLLDPRDHPEDAAARTGTGLCWDSLLQPDWAPRVFAAVDAAVGRVPLHAAVHGVPPPLASAPPLLVAAGEVLATVFYADERTIEPVRQQVGVAPAGRTVAVDSSGRPTGPATAPNAPFAVTVVTHYRLPGVRRGFKPRAQPPAGGSSSSSAAAPPAAPVSMLPGAFRPHPGLTLVFPPLNGNGGLPSEARDSHLASGLCSQHVKLLVVRFVAREAPPLPQASKASAAAVPGIAAAAALGSAAAGGIAGDDASRRRRHKHKGRQPSAPLPASAFLLRFRGSRPDGTVMLRVAVMSANAYRSSLEAMEEVMWAQDFYPLPPLAAAVGAGAAASSDDAGGAAAAPQPAHGGSTSSSSAAAAATASSGTTTFYAAPLVADFGATLRGFLSGMRVPADTVERLTGGIDFAPARGQLVGQCSGVHYHTPPAVGAALWAAATAGGKGGSGGGSGGSSAASWGGGSAPSPRAGEPLLWPHRPVPSPRPPSFAAVTPFYRHGIARLTALRQWQEWAIGTVLATAAAGAAVGGSSTSAAVRARRPPADIWYVCSNVGGAFDPHGLWAAGNGLLGTRWPDPHDDFAWVDAARRRLQQRAASGAGAVASSSSSSSAAALVAAAASAAAAAAATGTLSGHKRKAAASVAAAGDSVVILSDSSGSSDEGEQQAAVGSSSARGGSGGGSTGRRGGTAPMHAPCALPPPPALLHALSDEDAVLADGAARLRARLAQFNCDSDAVGYAPPYGEGRAIGGDGDDGDYDDATDAAIAASLAGAGVGSGAGVGQRAGARGYGNVAGFGATSSSSASSSAAVLRRPPPLPRPPFTLVFPTDGAVVDAQVSVHRFACELGLAAEDIDSRARLVGALVAPRVVHDGSAEAAAAAAAQPGTALPSAPFGAGRSHALPHSKFMAPVAAVGRPRDSTAAAAAGAVYGANAGAAATGVASSSSSSAAASTAVAGRPRLGGCFSAFVSREWALVGSANTSSFAHGIVKGGVDAAGNGVAGGGVNGAVGGGGGGSRGGGGSTQYTPVPCVPRLVTPNYELGVLLPPVVGVTVPSALLPPPPPQSTDGVDIDADAAAAAHHQRCWAALRAANPCLQSLRLVGVDAPPGELPFTCGVPLPPAHRGVWASDPRARPFSGYAGGAVGSLTGVRPRPGLRPPQVPVPGASSNGDKRHSGGSGGGGSSSTGSAASNAAASGSGSAAAPPPAGPAAGDAPDAQQLRCQRRQQQLQAAERRQLEAALAASAEDAALAAAIALSLGRSAGGSSSGSGAGGSAGPAASTVAPPRRAAASGAASAPTSATSAAEAELVVLDDDDDEEDDDGGGDARASEAAAVVVCLSSDEEDGDENDVQQSAAAIGGGGGRRSDDDGGGGGVSSDGGGDDPQTHRDDAAVEAAAAAAVGGGGAGGGSGFEQLLWDDGGGVDDEPQGGGDGYDTLR